MLRSLAVAVVLVQTFAVASAQGRSQRSNLGLTGIAGVPATVAPGTKIVVRGRVIARRANARRVVVRAALLRSGGSNRLGVVMLRKLRRDTERPFRIRTSIPTRNLPAGPMKLRVCARSARGHRARCRQQTITVAATAAPTPAATPAPSTAPATTATPGSTATPTPSPTVTPAPTVAPGVNPGAETVGDVLFPKLGNGGYDVQHYGLDLTYTPVLDQLGGSATIAAKATQDLSRFSLDFVKDFAVSAVTVNGAAAKFASAGDTKLQIGPATPIPADSTFTVVVTYAGSPPTIEDEDSSSEGFLNTADGAVVVCEPMGAMGWFPSNNHPSDKAALTLKMTVPSPLEVIGNGLLTARKTENGSTSFTWDETHPMATYLATSTIGVFNLSQGTTPKAKVPLYDAVDPAVAGAVAIQGNIAREGEALDFLVDTYGDYPFANAGSIVDNAAAQITYALETQTKPVYPLPPDVITVSHELAHQWFGDSVSLTQWQDIWLNEGFATYSEWLFGEKKDGGDTTTKHFDDLYARKPDNAFWKVPPAKPPTQSDVFGEAVYARGSMTLEKLRQIVGDTTFYDIMRTWVATHKYGNATTAQFIALSKAKSGKNLDAFFQDWLYDADKPTILSVP